MRFVKIAVGIAALVAIALLFSIGAYREWERKQEPLTISTNEGICVRARDLPDDAWGRLYEVGPERVMDRGYCDSAGRPLSP